MKNNENLILRKSAPEKTARMVETIYGCKWSLTVYYLIKNGIHRPGLMTRSVEGLSTKVLNACLQRNVKFGILERITFSEVPPRVEYRVTPYGEKFIRILDEIEQLHKDSEGGSHNTLTDTEDLSNPN